MSTHGSGVYEIALALEEGGDITEELPGETIDPCEGISKVSRLCPDTGGPQYDVVYLFQRRVRNGQPDRISRSNLFIERSSGRASDIKRIYKCPRRKHPVKSYLKLRIIISSSLLSIASKSWDRDGSRSEYEPSVTGESAVAYPTSIPVGSSPDDPSSL